MARQSEVYADHLDDDIPVLTDGIDDITDDHYIVVRYAPNRPSNHGRMKCGPVTGVDTDSLPAIEFHNVRRAESDAILAIGDTVADTPLRTMRVTGTAVTVGKPLSALVWDVDQLDAAIVRNMDVKLYTEVPPSVMDQYVAAVLPTMKGNAKTARALGLDAEWNAIADA